MAAKKPDPLFAAYAASAPALDLLYYVTYAQRHRDEYTETTRAIVADMLAYLDVMNSQPVSTQKRTVWTLIDRFKGSIPKWGNAGKGDDITTFESGVSFYVRRPCNSLSLHRFLIATPIHLEHLVDRHAASNGWNLPAPRRELQEK